MGDTGGISPMPIKAATPHSPLAIRERLPLRAGIRDAVSFGRLRRGEAQVLRAIRSYVNALYGVRPGALFSLVAIWNA